MSTEVPGECGEAEVVDVGRNWVTLSWKRPDARGAGPILAYKVEAWSSDHGARWIEVKKIVFIKLKLKSRRRNILVRKNSEYS